MLTDSVLFSVLILYNNVRSFKKGLKSLFVASRGTSRNDCVYVYDYYTLRKARRDRCVLAVCFRGVSLHNYEREDYKWPWKSIINFPGIRNPNRIDSSWTDIPHSGRRLL